MSQTKAQLVGGVGISTAENVVVGSAVTINSTGIDVVGVITATSFSGDGSGLSNTGSTLSAASGSQRVVVTTQTSGTMTASATDGDLTYDANSDTLNTANLHVTGISTLGSTNGIGKVTIGIGTTALLVEGNARVTGILTVGTGSITLDGTDNSVTVGSGATITGSGNVNVSGTITGSTACVRGTFTSNTSCVSGTLTAANANIPGTICGATVCATTGFSGNGSSLTNLTAANIPGLPALIPSGAVVCTTTFTSPGTFSKNPADDLHIIHVIGGGGGGGNGGCYITGYVPGPTPYSQVGGGGGGAGAGAYLIASSPQISPSVPVTVGSGGAAATPGGSSCFGNIVVNGGCGGCSAFQGICPGPYYFAGQGARGNSALWDASGASGNEFSGACNNYGGIYGAGSGADAPTPGSQKSSIYAGNGGAVGAAGCNYGGGGSGGCAPLGNSCCGFSGAPGAVIVYSIRG
jgi:hypothetical protein